MNTPTIANNQPPRNHQRTKSSVLRAFGMHRRTDAQGDGLAPAPAAAARPASSRPLEEVSLNCQPATAGGGGGGGGGGPSPSPPPPLSPAKKTRGFLSRPKSLKNLHKLASRDGAAEDEGAAPAGERGRHNRDKSRPAAARSGGGGGGGDSAGRDKENCAPAPQQARPPTPPIYAQFCSTGTGSSGSGSSGGGGGGGGNTTSDDVVRGRQQITKPRPASYHPASSRAGQGSGNRERASPTAAALDDGKDLEAHLEALLDRRNIPEHQRYKMRNLTDTIKRELIRQDWAEARAKQQQQGHSSDGGPAAAAAGIEVAAASPVPAAGAASPVKPKHARGKSMTLSKVVARGRSTERGTRDSGADGGSSEKRHKSPGSPLKRRFEAGTLGRHLRSKSTESVVLRTNSDGGSSSWEADGTKGGSGGGGLSGMLGRGAPPPQQQQHGPADFVRYLQTVQAPEAVAVGKLQKLRQLLRNETVAWTEAFVGQGGMAEVVGLLYRILGVEWREEHEDALLHETLLCLKALCTTAAALAYVDAIHGSLLPALIHMLFDPEKKGPSEFATRHLVTWVLFAYIERAPSAAARAARAATVLAYLRDDNATAPAQVVPFVLEMRKARPYRVWCKEVVSVTKEVFWIFLHQLNVVALETPDEGDEGDEGVEGDDAAYMARHFPRARAPVPAAPYVGGVEWEATNYLASHVDLVNAIVACTPTAAGRNALRAQMAMSGWERCLGGSLRLCKEKFYGAVHDGLRTWVAAAHADGWAVRDVRYGPGGTGGTGPGSGPGPYGGETPQLAMPQLDFVLD